MKNSKTHEPQITSKILRIACVTALGMAFTLSLPQAAHAQNVTPPPVPAGLEVPAPNQAFLVGHAVGTQNYVCQPSHILGRVDWVLFTSQATLFDDQSAQIITHFFSPNPDEGGVIARATWQDSRDTSTVWAQSIASATVDSDAITWVKLQVAGKRLGPTGGIALSGSTFVQRLNTKGGLAPATGCEVLSDVGHKAFRAIHRRLLLLQAIASGQALTRQTVLCAPDVLGQELLHITLRQVHAGEELTGIVASAG
jgi:Protein of unknown function (DUF3455)